MDFRRDSILAVITGTHTWSEAEQCAMVHAHAAQHHKKLELQMSEKRSTFKCGVEDNDETTQRQLSSSSAPKDFLSAPQLRGAAAG